MKLSVIVPAYNVAPYLSKCLDSIIEQGHTDMEVIVVNDGSTDDTPVIARKYSGIYPFIKIFDIDYSGPSKARNTALDVASGDWISFVDGDDFLLPGAFKHMLELAENNSADIVMGRYILTRDIDSVPPYTKNETNVLDGHLTACRMLYQKHHVTTTHPSVWGKMFRRELWNTARLPEGKYYEDLFVIPVMTAACSRIVTTGKPVYAYRLNPEGILSTLTTRHHDSIEASLHLQKVFAKDPLLSKAARSRLYSAAYNMLLKLNSTDTDMPVIEKECREIIRRYAWQELTDGKARLKNRIGAFAQWIPFILHNRWLSKKLLTR